MTLHWWNHWFWITCLAATACLCSPTSNIGDEAVESLKQGQPTATTPEVSSARLISRTGKAIGHSPKTPLPLILSTSSYQKVSIVFPLPTSSDTDDDGSSLQGELAHRIDFQKITEDHSEDDVDLVPPTTINIVEKNVTLNETVSSKHIINQIEESDVKNITESPKTDNDNHTTTNVTTLPIILPIEKKVNISKGIKNDIEPVKTTTESDMAVIPMTENVLKNNSINIIDDIEETSVSTVRALSLETAVGRRAANIPSNTVTSSSDEDQGLDAGAVAGICFGTLVLMALAGAVSFVLYRRRYLNKPQTLNDKCSNPDSSGYIDDSTIRENSEEMYSLDNDSFLNSLEAMTIQNYWTDSVKHTKL